MVVKQSEQFDLLSIPLLRLTIEGLSADPTIRPAGSIYYNTVGEMIRWSNGTVWSDVIGGGSDTPSEILTKLLTVDGATSGLDADLLDGQEGIHYLDRANHTGTQLAATISDLATAISGLDAGSVGGSALVDILNRTNHTGTQGSATISDFAAAVDARISAAFTNDAVSTLYDSIQEITQELIDDDAETAGIITSLAGKAVSGRTATFGDAAATSFSIANPVGINASVRCVDATTGTVSVVPAIQVTATTFEVVFTNYVPAAGEFEIAYVG